MHSVRYPGLTKYANPAMSLIQEAPRLLSRGVFPATALGMAGLGAAGLYGYQQYQAEQKRQADAREAAARAKTPVGGLDSLISPDRQGSTGLGALIGAGIGGYLGYDRDQDPRSALLGALAGAGVGGGAGYMAAPYFQQQRKDVNEMAKNMPVLPAQIPGQLPMQMPKSAAAQAYLDEFSKVACGGGNYDYDLRTELNEDDKRALLSYLKLMKDLDYRKFQTFAVERGLHPDSAETYIYQVMHELLQKKEEDPAPKTAGGAQFLDTLMKFADAADEGDSKLREKLTDEDKTAIHEYIRDTPGLVDENFHAFVEARGMLPSAAETYTYNLLQKMLEEESSVDKGAAGTKYLQNLLKFAQEGFGDHMADGAKRFGANMVDMVNPKQPQLVESLGANVGVGAGMFGAAGAAFGPSLDLSMMLERGSKAIRNPRLRYGALGLGIGALAGVANYGAYKGIKALGNHFADKPAEAPAPRGGRFDPSKMEANKAAFWEREIPGWGAASPEEREQMMEAYAARNRERTREYIRNGGVMLGGGKGAGAEGYINGFIKAAALDPYEDPSMTTQVLDTMSRNPYLVAAAAAVPGFFLGRAAGRGMMRGAEMLGNRFGGKLLSNPALRSPENMIGVGAAMGGLSSGYLGSRFAQYALNNPSLDLDLAGSTFNAPPARDYF